MLSANAPTVVEVHLSSSQWSEAFVDYLHSRGLGDGGYRIPVGSANQSKPLPWNNVDRIAVTFSEDVDVQIADFSISGASPTAIHAVDFFYDAISHVAIWTLSAPLTRNLYRIDIDGDSAHAIRDLSGNALDGEWTNNVSTFASGDGTAGGDFEFQFRLLPGDVTQSNLVDISDYSASYYRQGQTTTSANFLAFADINGNGVHDGADNAAIYSTLYWASPTGTPTGVVSDAPSAAEPETVQITNATSNYSISLFSMFDDNDDDDTALDFAIESVSNPDLFDSVTINLQTGALVLNAAWAMSGRSSITVSATDTSGLKTLNTFYADVAYQNVRPEIWATAAYQVDDTWVVEGIVTDADDDVVGMIVYFSGAFEARATVQDDGRFKFVVVVHQPEWDTETAFVVDPHGLSSASYYFPVYLT
jgi:hypothetical protein